MTVLTTSSKENNSPNLLHKNINKNKQKKPISTITHTLATQAAGAISTILLYPIDVVKMRFISQDGTIHRQHNGQTYHSIRKALFTIYNEEGIKALFRGCHIAVLGSVMAWGVYMFLYRFLCNISEIWIPKDEKNKRIEYFIRSVFISGIASSSSAIVCNPIWLIKTRMQLEENVKRHNYNSKNNEKYLSFIRGITLAIQSDGFLSLWRGLSAQILLGLPNALNFPLYETLKSYRLYYTSRESLNTYEICLCSTLAKTFVTIFAHPIQVLKTRLQDHRSRCGNVQYISLLQSTSLILRKYGFRGMYRGIIPSFLQTVPRLVMTFVLYEHFCSFASS